MRTREQLKQKLYDKYIRPTERPSKHLIGIEIEMPVVHLGGLPTDYEVTQRAFQKAVEHFALKPQKYDIYGVCFSATDPVTEDNLSFDCSYNNLELSFGVAKDLTDLDRRFQKYVSYLNEVLREDDHLLTGMGVNPNYQINRTDFVPTGRYQMLEQYLKKSRSWEYPMYFHPYPEFGAYASASQIQLDVEKDNVLEVIDLFTKLEPVKAVLFNNAVMKSEPELLCVRDLFWENSTHGINPHNVGNFECELRTVDDLLEYIATTSIFCTERAGHYLFFQPVPILEYLERPEIAGEYYDAQSGGLMREVFVPSEEDLAYLRTYKYEDLTFRGTVEFRSVCCQPLKEAFTVGAFHVGLMQKLAEARVLLAADRVLYHHGFSASELRKIMNRREWPDFVDRKGLRELCLAVLDLARAGLQERQLGEEVYLDPLYERAAALRSPGRYMVESLEAGVPADQLVREFSL